MTKSILSYDKIILALSGKYGNLLTVKENNNAGNCQGGTCMKRKFKVGEIVGGCDIYRFFGVSWTHVYEILDVEEKLRFGKPDQLLTVRRSDSNGKVLESSEKRWSGQLF